MKKYLKVCSTCSKVYASKTDIVNKGSRIHICDGGNLWFNCSSCDSTFFIPKKQFEQMFFSHEIPVATTYSANAIVPEQMH